MRLFLVSLGCIALMGACNPHGVAHAQHSVVAHHAASFCASDGSRHALSRHARAVARTRLVEMRAADADAWRALPSPLLVRADAIADRGECS